MIAKVVPESCQRTEGIFAWLEMREEKLKKQFQKEREKREKEEMQHKETDARNRRNAERQKGVEQKMRKKLTKNNIEDKVENE